MAYKKRLINKPLNVQTQYIFKLKMANRLRVLQQAQAPVEEE